MNGNGLFIQQGFLHPKHLCSLIPTRRPILRRIAGSIQDDTKRKVIVELGPGIGGLAEEILGRDGMTKDSLLILIDIVKKFSDHLKQLFFTDPRVRVHHDSAVNVRGILTRHHEAYADYIFSSIPLTKMNPEQSEEILQEISRSLAPDGVFCTYIFLARHTRSLLEQYFPEVRLVRRERWNLPPLAILEARKHTLNHKRNGEVPSSAHTLGQLWK